MGILRADRITGLGGANAIKGSVEMRGRQNIRAEIVDGNADFNLGSSDYTVECWYHRGGTSGTAASYDQDLVMLWNNTNNRRSWGLFYDADGNLGLIGSSDGSNSDMGSFHSYTFPDNNLWYHIAAVRISNTVTIYVNGVVLGSATVSGSYYKNTQDNLVIGGQLSGTSYDSKIVRGSLSNVRIIIGDGIYTGAFTPPTHELTVTPNTKLLCCQSPSNILQEATGKKLIAYRSTLNDSFAKSSTFTPNTPIGFSTTTNVGSQYGTTFDGFGSFATSTYMFPPGGNTRERNRGRALWMGGYSPSNYRTMIDFVNIQSTGNAQDFGELSQTGLGEGSECASSTRAVQGGGSLINVMEFVTIADTSNTTDFGDLTVSRRSLDALSNDTRGIWAGGTTNPAMSDVIDFATIATTGNATDFGNLTVGRRNMGTVASPTRGVFAGGNPGSSPLTDDTMDYITIGSAGNAIDFGNLSGTYREGAGCSNGTRGVFNVGGPGADTVNTMEFITIATTGNTTDYGDLFYAVGNAGGTSNGTRGVFGGGAGAAYTNIIQFITISTLGDAADFGDLTFTRIPYGATSDSHGGLS